MKFGIFEIDSGCCSPGSEIDASDHDFFSTRRFVGLNLFDDFICWAVFVPSPGMDSGTKGTKRVAASLDHDMFSCIQGLSLCEFSKF